MIDMDDTVSVIIQQWGIPGAVIAAIATYFGRKEQTLNAQIREADSAIERRFTEILKIQERSVEVMTTLTAKVDQLLAAQKLG